MEQNPNLLSTELHIDPTAEMHLRETARWARFLGIVGFVMAALVAVLSFVFPFIISRASQADPYNSMAGMGTAISAMITIVYLLMAALMFTISWFVFKFGTSTKVALLQNDQETLNVGLLNLKRVFRIYGVMTAIMLVIFALSMLVSLVSLI